MTYESWHGNNFTRVHTTDCSRRATDSESNKPMELIGTFDSIDAAVSHAKTSGHRVKVCKLCCPENRMESVKGGSRVDESR